MKSFGPGKNVLVRLAAWASPRAFGSAQRAGRCPTRLNDLEPLQGVGFSPRSDEARLNPGGPSYGKIGKLFRDSSLDIRSVGGRLCAITIKQGKTTPTHLTHF
ncbi:hypothetical protein LF1_38430 [Rubripirellula obstinata]|uniref:Uncharacterized protein n=1 Tax=Rubripirellula obstinata TaxID=406547 RepID=A0A5B1CL92_9BACT|nr:hypothetical protein LF1_38430 [Rubripirellula obstinata]